MFISHTGWTHGNFLEPNLLFSILKGKEALQIYNGDFNHFYFSET